MPSYIKSSIVLVVGLYSVFQSLSLRADDFQVGTCVTEITPPIPYRMSGYFSERLSTGTKDPLFAKTIVLRQGESAAAIVFCDLVGIAKSVSESVRAKAEKLTGIPASHICVVATHSHTGPLYFGALRKHFHDRMVSKSGKDTYETVDYPSQLISKLVGSIEKANRTVKPAVFRIGSATEKRLSFNRRFYMKGGGVRFNPGQQNPNIIRVAGPIDSEVGLVSFAEKSSGKPNLPFAAIVNFALHLDTVGGTEYSGDYPKHLQDTLRQSYGDNFISMFGAGTCGDINHIDVKIKGRRTATEIGTMLGQTVVKKLPDLITAKKPSLAIAQTKVKALLQTFTQEEIAKAKEHMQSVDNSKLTFLERVHAYKVNAVLLRNAKSIDLEVQAIRLSSQCAIVFLPGEVFVDLGQAIKNASPFETTLVIELTNDAPGYIPTKKAFAEGSYETVNSRIQSGYGEKMTTAAIRLLKQLDSKP